MFGSVGGPQHSFSLGLFVWRLLALYGDQSFRLEHALLCLRTVTVEAHCKKDHKAIQHSLTHMGLLQTLIDTAERCKLTSV